MRRVEYVELPPEAIDLIEPLWTALHAHHQRASEYTRVQPGFSWEARKALLLREPGAPRLTLVAREGGALVGYCLSNLSPRGVGEVDSLYVAPEVRGLGVGAELTRRSVAWLEAHEAKRIQLHVAVGNEEAIPFYERLGFTRRATVLQYCPAEE